jgi:hypothetical protein
MKKIMKINPLAVMYVCVALLLGFSSCKKENTSNNTDNTTPNTPTGTVMFHLHTYLENTEVDGYNIVYTTDEGRKISLTRAQFYISAIQLVRLDGTLYDITDKKILKELETDVYFIADVPVGNYKSVKFKVGLDAATNQSNPFPSVDSAILNRPEMWFSSTAQPDGYVFMNVEGKIDTTSDASGTVANMQPFSYKIGTNANYKQVSMPDRNFTVIKDQVQYVHILADYYRLFNSIEINVSNNLTVATPADNATSLANIIANSIPSMFVYE